MNAVLCRGRQHFPLLLFGSLQALPILSGQNHGVRVWSANHIFMGRDPGKDLVPTPRTGPRRPSPMKQYHAGIIVIQLCVQSSGFLSSIP